ncbi:glycosyltransferase family 1 protein [Sulfurimonas sp. HSL1-6]|uniref:glycosyltransferase family 4 protein n=1 Tax=Thiomicrolovo immobilis TaxID=3131935 RepID=UPI0031F8C07C
MRICIFTDTIGDLNGVSRFIQDMGEQALLHDVDLHIVASTAKYCPDLPNVHNLPPRWRVPMPFYRELDLAYPSAAALERILRELRPDIVHISTPGPVGVIAKKLAAKQNLPVLGTYHTDFPAYIRDNTGLEWAKRIADRTMARFYRPFRRVFTRSTEYLEIMEREIGIERARSELLSPGTNRKRFHPSHRSDSVFAKYGATGEGPKVLYVGRISKEKNVPFLLDVWQRYKASNPGCEAELLLVGEGALRRKRANLALEDVIFAGPVIGDDLSRLYASCDLFVFPSVTDTLGQVVMEAQASRVCCLVSDVGGPQGIVNPGGNAGGMVVKGNDTDAWIAALEALLENATLRQNFGKQGYENMQHFNIIDSFTHFVQTHRDALHRHRP